MKIPVQFKSLGAGQKFECSDMAGVHEKVCGNAAVCKVNGSYQTFTFGPDDIVFAFTAVAHIQEVANV